MQRIRQLGLARTRTGNLRRQASLLLEFHGGKVPSSFAALEALPGVGHNTASVVMARAFGVPGFPVATQIDRLAQLWMLSEGRRIEPIAERDLKRLFGRKAWNRLQLRIVFYGQGHCNRHGCDGRVCGL